VRLDAGRSKLYTALKDLTARWEQVRDTWDDSQRRDFEERVWEPLVRMSEDAMRGMDALAQVLTTMRNDCEGRGAFHL